ncbi:apolipoprotein N-acyltransferase [Spirosoma aerolatum]|uniref:apolipoprotein N-acyltransferase n=1 Tax=Spirosoma aerolatum TaxID=1211326 RepID=UPI0014731879|nr:apolipoprotein N-acyltransferase [Spirosoma aerolatum]
MLKRLPAWLISGLLYGLAWPNFTFETGWFAWFTLVPVLLRLRSVQTFGEHVRVTLPLFVVIPPLVCWWLSYVSIWAVPTVILTQSLFLWIPMALHFSLQQRFGWRKALLLLPLSWTVWEWLWLAISDVNLAVGNPVYTQARLLFLNQFVDLTGQWGLLAWLIGMNVLLARIVDQSTDLSERLIIRRVIVGVSAWLAAPIVYSALVSWQPTLVIDKHPSTVRVGLLQTNEDPYTPVKPVNYGQKIQRLIRLGTKAIEQEPDLVVAPEGAFPLPLLRDSTLFAGMRQYVAYYNVPFATGLMTPIDSNHYYNEAFVFTPELSRVYTPLHLTPNDLKVYRKQKSLVFGERLPTLLNWAGRWLRPNKSSIILGDAPFVFQFHDRKQNPRSVAIAICWEQLYPSTIAGLVRVGSDQTANKSADHGLSEFLIFSMNDGWFYDSPGPRMLLAFSQLRAIENRRSIARCSNQGYSGYVDPFGQVISVLPRQQEATSNVTLMTNTKLTVFTKYPDWFPLACSLVLVLSLLSGSNRKSTKAILVPISQKRTGATIPHI